MPRFNKSTNPSAATNVTGWLGAGTRTRITGLSGPPRTTGGSVPSGSGSFSASISAAPAATTTSGQVWSGVLWVRHSNARTVRVTITTWNGTSSVASVGVTDVALSANVWTEIRTLGTLAAGTFTGVTVHVDLPTTGTAGTLSISSSRIEQVSDAAIAYGDGDDTGTGWSWDGTAGNSTSTKSDALPASGTSTITAGQTATAGRTDVTATSTVTAGLSGTAIRLDVSATGSATTTAGLTGSATKTDTTTAAPATTAAGATATALKILNVAGLVAPATQQSGYVLMCVARVQQATGPPQFYDVDPIPWTALTWTDELSAPQSLQSTCKLTRFTPAVMQRLEKPAELPLELWLYRNGKLVFAGPMVTYPVQGEDTLTINAVGVLGYCAYWFVTTDLIYSGVDQHLIAKGLVDHWQALDYGNFGIDTSAVAPSGVVRDHTYLRKESNPIGQRLAELGRRENGFDVSVDPASRQLQLWYPGQGVDRSEGASAVVFDRLSVASGNVSCSIAPGDLASEAFGVGTSPDAGTVYSTMSNPDLRAQFGRIGVARTFDGVSEQSTLDDHTLGMLNARAQPLMIPAPDLRIVPDADLSMYGVGDTVSYQLSRVLGITGAFRIRKRTVTVRDNSPEKATVEFV